MVAQHRCCVPRCTVIKGDGVTMHVFPNPSKLDEIERFRTWVMKIGGDIVGEDDLYIFRNRRVCHRHFEEIYLFPNNRLTRLAIPSLHIPGVHVGPRITVPKVLEESGEQPKQTKSSAEANPANQGPNQIVPMELDAPIVLHKQAASIDEISPPVASTPGAVNDRGMKFRKGPNQIVPMELDAPIVLHKQAASIDEISPPVASTPGAVNDRGMKFRKGTRATIPKPMSKVEKELRYTLAETKIALRKCQKAKNKLRTNLQLANKITKTSAFEMLSKKMSPAAKSFFEMQISQFGKKAKGRRFTIDEKILALSLYKPCPKAYKLLSKICILPKRNTLDKVLKKINIVTGINEILFENLKKKVQRMPSHHRLCTLVFDEMAIAPHVAYNKGNDIITGFVDNGEERQKKFCDHVLVFMVRGVIKKFKQPVAFSFCAGSTKSADLKKQIETVIVQVMKTGLQVVATVCDQGTTNMAALNELMKKTRECYIKDGNEYKGGFFKIENQKIYVLYDPPHLMKGIRNNLLTKNLQYVMGGKARTAKWAHIVGLYQRGPGYKGVRLVNKLTAMHVMPNLIPKMRVKFCTQVFSQNVGVTMGYMAGLGKLPKESTDTADILLLFDKLFDSVNGSFSRPVKGKIYRSAVTPSSPHRKLWYKALPILKTMKFVNNNGVRSVVPSISSWVKTIEAFLNVTKYLHSLGLNSLLLRHFNQDPLENFFGSVRAHGLRNIMPSASAFIGAYKALLVSNLTSPYSVGFNCEEDENTFLQSLKFLVTTDVKTKKNRDILDILESHMNIPEINTEQLIRSESLADKEKCAAIAYCSGWLVKLLKTNISKTCEPCNRAMESETIQDFHQYIKIREYQNDKTWLCYPTRAIFDYFCQLENIVIEIMKSSCDIERISEYVELVATINVNANFITCNDHREMICKAMLKKCISFFLHNWCKEINQIINGKTNFFDEEDEMKRAAHEYNRVHKRRSQHSA